MSVAKFSVERPLLVNLFAFVLLVAGAWAANAATREDLPAVATGWCTIATTYPGASSAEVEELVTTPLEAVASRHDGVAEIWSQSREGYSMMYLRFGQEVQDVDRAVMELGGAFERDADLPEGADAPRVQRFVVNLPVLSIAVRGDVSEARLRSAALEVADEVERLPGVRNVNRYGLRAPRLRVHADPDRMRAARVPLAVLRAAVESRAANVPVGRLENESRAINVRGMLASELEELEDIVVRPFVGGAVRVRDVARVEAGFAPAEVSGQVLGEPSAVLHVIKAGDADLIDVSAATRARVEELRAGMPPGVRIDVFGDGAPAIERSLSTLYENAAVGLLLVVATLWLFVGFRGAFMAALGVPVAVAGALALMSVMGVTINALSLLALILSLGVIVDDAIIVIENVERHVDEGASPRRAAIDGTMEVFWPVVASTMTTVAAFAPLLLVAGVLGDFFAIIPKVVIAALLASLFECALILPSHLAGGSHEPEDGDEGHEGHEDAPRDDSSELEAPAAIDEAHPSGLLQRAKTRLSAIAERGSEHYERILRGALRHPFAVVALAYGLTIAVLVLAATARDVVLFIDGDVDTFDVRLTMPSDASPEATERVLAEIERRILDLDDPNVEVTMGIRGICRTDFRLARGDHYGMVTVHLVPAESRTGSRAGQEVFGRVQRLFDDLVGPSALEVVAVRTGPPRAAPIAIRVEGQDLARLAEVADEIRRELGRVPNLHSLTSDYDTGARELRVRVDEAAAARFGFAPAQVAVFLRDAFGTLPLATLRSADAEEPVRLEVGIDPAYRDDPAALAALTLIAPDGETHVPLGDLVHFEPSQSASVLRHQGGERAITVTARVDEEHGDVGEANAAIEPRIAELAARFRDVRIVQGGQYEETKASLHSLARAFAFAALLIFVILVAQFRSLMLPWVVMAAIPLSLFGVAIGLLARPGSVGFIALVGVVGLAGIVVNDSLVLVDFIDRRRRDGMETLDAIALGARLRLRPILLTSITTVAGLMPLSFETEELPMLAPMATAIAWGLAFATILTLIVVPCLYLAAIRVREFAASRVETIRLGKEGRSLAGRVNGRAATRG